MIKMALQRTRTEDFLRFELLTRRQGGFTDRRAAGIRRVRSRRKLVLVLLLMAVMSSCAGELFTVRPRSVWMRTRSCRWWEDVVLNSFEHHDWVENFRVSRDTFYYLCQQLRPVIQKQDTHLRQSVSTERRVAITLWVLATATEYRTVAHLFGIARNTVCVIVHETCAAIVEKLLPKYVNFPSGDGIKEVTQGFKDRWGVPQCVGSIDGSHVPVKPPVMNHTDYYNRKGWYSMLVQAVVDHKYLFRNLCIGWPGSVHDARVLSNSSLYKKINSGELLVGGETFKVQRRRLPLFLLGDSAYPLLPWLIKPFSFSTSLSSDEKLCNYRISRARVVVECAFGRLKGRWRRLSKQMDIHIDNVPNIIAACCVLHNICEVHRDCFNDDWLQEVEDSLVQPPNISNSSSNTTGGNEVRDILMEYFKLHP